MTVPYAGKGKPRGRYNASGNPDPRTERIDIRLTTAEREKLTAYAKAQRRTITSVFAEFLDWLDTKPKP